MKIYSGEVLKVLPSAIMFDLDDTLYDYATPHEVALQTVIEMVSSFYGLDGETVKSAFKGARERVKLDLNGDPASRSRLLYFQVMLEKLGLGSAPAWALNCEQTYWHTFLRDLRPFDGVCQFLECARLLNVPRVIVSNQATQIQFRKLCQLHLDEAFDFIITSERVGVEKPQKKIFAESRSLVDCDASQIWMIGDDVEADINGAKEALGCFTFLKRNGRKFNRGITSNCDVVFEDFTQLIPIISKIQKTSEAS